MNTFKSTAEELIDQGVEKGVGIGMEKGVGIGMEKGLDKGILIGEILSLERNAGIQQTPVQELRQLSLEELQSRRKRLNS